MLTRSRAKQPIPEEVAPLARLEFNPPTAGLVSDSSCSGGIGGPTGLVTSEQGQAPDPHSNTDTGRHIEKPHPASCL